MPDEELLLEFMSTRSGPVEVTDFSGNVRAFTLSGYLTTGYTLVAKEQTEDLKLQDRVLPHGYEFSAFSYSSPHEAYSILVEKLRVALATRNLDPNNYPHLLLPRCAGRVESGGVVIDGSFVPWVSFIDVIQSYEGWVFEVKFGGD
jgi:predicted component of type VI protein secretion system